MHVTLVRSSASGEQKTKPTQHSVTELRSRGIQPDAIVCRSEQPISDSLKRKISNLCDVPIEGVVNAADAESLYEIPIVLHEEGLDRFVSNILRLPSARRLPSGPISTGCARSKAHRSRRHVGSTSASSRYLSVVGRSITLPVHNGQSRSLIEAETVTGLFAGRPTLSTAS